MANDGLVSHLGLGSNIHPSDLKVPNLKICVQTRNKWPSAKHETLWPSSHLGLGLFGRRPFESSAI